MNICTICTGNQPWLTHLERWFRYAKISNPQAKLHLILAGSPELLTQGIIKEFDDVKLYDPSVICRPWFNEVRMDATDIFGVDEMLYIDCDCDIHERLDDVMADSKLDLGYCRSPWIHPHWTHMSEELGYGAATYSANNGLLYMRRSFKKEYAEARARIEEVQKGSRIGGILVFNTMLRMNPLLAYEIAYEYSVIWHDWAQVNNVPVLRTAKTIQYCSDQGQQKRLFLEQTWRNSL
jgi:hypothetical protein